MKMIQQAALAAFLLGMMSCGSNVADTTTRDTSSTNTDTTATAAGTDSSLLFDGKTLAGWHTYGLDKPGTAWSVDSSAIHLKPAASKGYQSEGGGDLITNDEYSNFDLKLEWKIAKGGNSGIILFVHEDTMQYKETWNTGLEMQVLDNDGHPDAKIIKHRAGDLYDLISGSPETVKPAGEWNAVEVKSYNGKLDFYLNGTHTLSTTLWDDNWKKLVAGSKFKDMPGFGTYKSGHIALQDHGFEVWYKNISLHKL